MNMPWTSQGKTDLKLKEEIIEKLNDEGLISKIENYKL